METATKFKVLIDVSAPARQLGQATRNLVYGYDNVTASMRDRAGDVACVELVGSRSDLLHVLRRYFSDDQESAESYFNDRAKPVE